MEPLNLDYHISKLVLKALNKYPLKKGAAKALGISDRSLLRYTQQFDIIWNDDYQLYYIKGTQPRRP